MKHITRWLKVFTLLLFSTLFGTQLFAKTAPTAVDDTQAGVTGTPTTVNAIGNDTDPEDDINASTINFTDPAGTDTDGDGDADQLIVPGEGTWQANPDGTVTFTPEAGFTGDPTPVPYTVTDNTLDVAITSLDDPYTVPYTVTDNTGLESNPATITIDYAQLPEIAIIKTGTLNDGGDGLQVGDTIDYEFNVTNTGNVPLTNITVDDARIGVAALPVSDLAPGASQIVTATYTLVAQDIADGNVTNQATANAEDPEGNPVTDQSDDNSPTEDDPTVVAFTTQPPVANDDNATGTVSRQ